MKCPGGWYCKNKTIRKMYRILMRDGSEKVLCNWCLNRKYQGYDPRNAVGIEEI